MVFKATRIGNETEKRAIKITWDEPFNEKYPSFPSCTNYDTQIQLAKDNPDVFAPIKNIKMPVRDLIDNTLLPRSGICMTIMPLAEQDLSTALNFLYDAAEDNVVREAKLVDFIKTIVDMNLKFNYSGYLHGDMRPGNVLLLNENGKLVPKLNDFDLLHNIEQKIATKKETWCEKYVTKEKWKLFNTVTKIIKANDVLVKVSQDTLDQLDRMIFEKYQEFGEKTCKHLSEEFSEKLRNCNHIIV